MKPAFQLIPTCSASTTSVIARGQLYITKATCSGPNPRTWFCKTRNSKTNQCLKSADPLLFHSKICNCKLSLRFCWGFWLPHWSQCGKSTTIPEYPQHAANLKSTPQVNFHANIFYSMWMTFLKMLLYYTHLLQKIHILRLCYTSVHQTAKK